MGAVKFKSDVPSEAWLEQQRQWSVEDGRLQWGCFRNFGKITAQFSGDVRVPLAVLRQLHGERGEQAAPDRKALTSLLAVMSSTGELPVGDGGPLVPYIEVDQEGVAWVNEGNHRIMAADQLGWSEVPVMVRYFNGGEREEGLLHPQRITGWNREIIQMDEATAVVAGAQQGEAFERFLDDGQFYIEWNNNFARDGANGFLMMRCMAEFTAPGGYTVGGGYERDAKGRWSADVMMPYEDKDSDCRVLGTFDTRNEAILALWQARESASFMGRHMERTDAKLVHAWREAQAAAEGRGKIVFGSMSEGKEFNGAVLHADGIYVVQNMGRGVAIHRAAVLSRAVQIGEVVTIKYDGHGRAKVPVAEVALER